MANTRCIAFVNQKGGVGKTTSVACIGWALAQKGKRVAAVDLDPQGNLTTALGIDMEEFGGPTTTAVMMDDWLLDDTFVPTSWGIDVAPTDIGLANREMSRTMGDEVVLRAALADMKQHYDYILVDCPPSLGLLTINGLTAAGEYVICVQPKFFANKGLGNLLATVEKLGKRYAPAPQQIGVVVSMYEKTIEAARRLQEIRDYFAEDDGSCPLLWEPTIPKRTVVDEALAAGTPLGDYGRSSDIAELYLQLAGRVING